MIRIAIVLLFLTLSGCGGAATHGGAAYTLTLSIGKQAEIPEEALTVLLTKINDSRCPSQVQCIIAREAIATLSVSQSGQESATLEIQTPAPSASSANQDTYRTYLFTLQSLEPHPITPDPIPIDQYRATVLIEKQ